MTESEEITHLKLKIKELENQRDGAIRARDDHFRNTKRLAHLCATAESKLRHIDKVLNHESPELIELGAKGLFLHDQHWDESFIDNPSVKAWFALKDGDVDKTYVDDMRQQSTLMLRIVFNHVLEQLTAHKPVSDDKE